MQQTNVRANTWADVAASKFCSLKANTAHENVSTRVSARALKFRAIDVGSPANERERERERARAIGDRRRRCVRAVCSGPGASCLFLAPLSFGSIEHLIVLHTQDTSYITYQ